MKTASNFTQGQMRSQECASSTILPSLNGTAPQKINPRNTTYFTRGLRANPLREDPRYLQEGLTGMCRERKWQASCLVSVKLTSFPAQFPASQELHASTHPAALVAAQTEGLNYSPHPTTELTIKMCAYNAPHTAFC